MTRTRNTKQTSMRRRDVAAHVSAGTPCDGTAMCPHASCSNAHLTDEVVVVLRRDGPRVHLSGVLHKLPDMRVLTDDLTRPKCAEHGATVRAEPWRIVAEGVAVRRGSNDRAVITSATWTAAKCADVVRVWLDGTNLPPSRTLVVAKCRVTSRLNSENEIDHVVDITSSEYDDVVDCAYPDEAGGVN